MALSCISWFRSRLPRLLRSLPWQRRVLGRRRVRIAVLLAGCLLIPAWQHLAARHVHWADLRCRITAASGVHHEARFVYFLYYLGLFPLATERADLTYSREGAEQALASHDGSLITEWDYTIRDGDLGTVFLYLFGAGWKGTPEAPSLRPANGLAFAVALVALFVAFWRIRQPLLGALLVLFLGSNPFQLREVYAHENVFGWPVTTAVLVLALHVPLLARRKRSVWALVAVPVAAGMLLAAVRQVRTEPAAMLLSAGLAYLAMGEVRWRVRLALVALLGLSFAAGSRGWEAYFDHKIAQAGRAVEAAGGHVYRGPRVPHQMIWHALWCGLGDFGEKHGYVWGDWAAAIYAHDAIRRRYGLTFPPIRKGYRYEGGYWDEAGKFRKTHAEVPHYSAALRDKVLDDIIHDPLWYLGVLARRAWRILCQTTPVHVGLGRWGLTLPMHGLVVFPVLALLVWSRAWLLLKLVLFMLPLSLTALLVYSGGGTPYYSCYHLAAAAVLCAGVVELSGAAARWRGAGGRSSR